jgi:hypothetical protein
MAPQHRRQHDSASSSQDSVALSLVGFDSAVISMTQHLHSTMTKLSRQHRHQYYSVVTSHNNLIVNINTIGL